MDADAAILEMQGLGIGLDPVTEGAFRAEVERINEREIGEIHVTLQATDHGTPALKREFGLKPADVPAPSKRRTSAKGTSAQTRKGGMQ